MNWIITFLISYLIGSFSSSYFFGKLFFKKDLSKEGSGNLGTKNSLDTHGLLFGILVFVVDFSKGFGTILLIKALYGNGLLLDLASVGVILGHNYSLYIGFKGGKGLASLVGVLSILNPVVLLILIILAAIFRVITKHDGVAAMLAAFPYAPIMGIATRDWRTVPFAVILTFLVFVKHRSEEYEALWKFLRIKG